MKARGWLGVGLVLMLGAVAAKAVPLVGTYRATDENVRAEIRIDRPSGPARGVLVLAGPGKPAEPTAGWRTFARENGLALCAVGLEVAKAAPQPEEKPEAAPEGIPLTARTPEALLEAALEDAKLSDLPRVLYGFRAGADLVLRLLRSRDRGILGWGVHAAMTFPSPARDIPYGLLAASDLDERNYDHARDHVEELRRRGADVAWVSLPGRAEANEEFQALVRQALTTVIAKNGRPVLVDNESEAERPRNLSGGDAATTSVLPSGAEVAPWRALHRPSGVLTERVATGLAEFPELVLALRLPSKLKSDRVLAYCYHHQEAGAILKAARDPNASWNRYAAERGLAVLTWNVKTLWRNLRSHDEIDNRAKVHQDATFDAVVRAWETGLKKLAARARIRDTGMLLYGCSRGSNFALRLAMRKPERFSVVVAHLANAFERPKPDAADVLWAITTGELDPGIANARRYYEQSRAKGLPMFLRVFSGLGHGENDESMAFAREFLDYGLEASAPGKNLARQVTKEMRSPEFVADLVNGLVFSASEASVVPEEQRVLLPNREVAAMWGRIKERASGVASRAGPAGSAAGGGVEQLFAEEVGQPPGVEAEIAPRAGAIRAKNGSPGTGRSVSRVELERGVATIHYGDEDRVERIVYSAGYSVFYRYDEGGKLAARVVSEDASRN